MCRERHLDRRLAGGNRRWLRGYGVLLGQYAQLVFDLSLFVRSGEVRLGHKGIFSQSRALAQLAHE